MDDSYSMGWVSGIPMSLIHKAALAETQEYYSRLRELETEGGIWSSIFHGEDPRGALAGVIAVLWDGAPEGSPHGIYEALVLPPSPEMTNHEATVMASLRLGDIFDAVRVVHALMPRIRRRARRLLLDASGEQE